MAPVYGDLSSHSVVVHDDQAELPDEYIVQTSYVEADTLVFSLQRRAVNESFAPQGNSFPHRLGPMAVSIWSSAAHGTPRC
jgi:hypothetical protein